MEKTKLPNKYMMLSVVIVFLITLTLFIKTARAQDKLSPIVLHIDIALQVPITKAQEEALNAIKTALIILQPDLVPVDGTSNKMKTHICNNLELSTEACVDETDITETDFTKVNPTSLPIPTPK